LMGTQYISDFSALPLHLILHEVSAGLTVERGGWL
jgi:hypothetical protein